MNRVIVDLEALNHNIRHINQLMDEHGASWTLVTKVLCGHSDTLKALQSLGIRSMADSRLANLKAIERVAPGFETWYLRLPHASAIPEIVSLAEVSLNSEIKTFDDLDAEAKRQGKIHYIIVMIELGDLREGVLPGSLIKHYQHAFELENVEVLGIGSNLGCLSGSVPNLDQFMQLILYRELLELKFKRKLPMISAGSSAVLPLLIEGKLPRAINHFRIGEAAFLGTDLVNGSFLSGFRSDAITVEAEIVEIKEKGLVPLGEVTDMTPFQPIQEVDSSPGSRGYRAIVTMGQLDTDVPGLTPIQPKFHISGASSDLTVINLGPDPGDLKIGDSLCFRPNYSALLRLMAGKYVDKVVNPSSDSFVEKHEDDESSAVPAIIENLPRGFSPSQNNEEE